MPLPANLLRFAIAHVDEPTLSVYVEGVPADPNARRAWRVRLSQELARVREQLADASDAERAAFDQCEADLLQRLPQSEATPSPTGWAFFRTARGDALALTIAAGAVETSVRWGPGPSVVPFLCVAAPETALVVRLDLEHAEIGRWRADALEPIERLDADRVGDVGPKMGGPPRQGFHGGTRGRARSDEVQRQRTDGQGRLVEQLLQSVRRHDDGQSGIVLGGTRSATVRFVSDLLPAMADRAIIAPALTMRSSPARIPVAIRTALQSLRQRRCERQVATLLEEAHSRGRAALGLESAREAADAGIIGSLLFSQRAWRDDPETVELLIGRALATGATVECAATGERSPLDIASEGIIAALRFPMRFIDHATSLEEA